MKITIEEEVRNFFRFGDGRQAIVAAVKENILKKQSFTVLDDV